LFDILLDSVGSPNSSFIHVWDTQLEFWGFAGTTFQFTTLVFQCLYLQWEFNLVISEWLSTCSFPLCQCVLLNPRVYPLEIF
jgi:hypothetical protein